MKTNVHFTISVQFSAKNNLNHLGRDLDAWAFNCVAAVTIFIWGLLVSLGYYGQLSGSAVNYFKNHLCFHWGSFPGAYSASGFTFASLFGKPKVLVIREFTSPLLSLLFYWLAYAFLMSCILKGEFQSSNPLKTFGTPKHWRRLELLSVQKLRLYENIQKVV